MDHTVHTSVDAFTKPRCTVR